MSASILITGANRGIGLEMARQYLAEGWRVFACCRQPDKATELAQLAHQGQGRLSVHALDVREEDSIAALKGELGTEPLDILLNNAGVFGPREQGFGSVHAADWLEALRVDTLAPLFMAQALVDNVAASRQRLIANISSRMGSIGENTSGGFYIYRSAKAGLNAVIKSLAIDLAPRGITTVALHPGWVQTEMGGPGAQITPAQSVTALRGVLARLTPAQSGTFLDMDGSTIPW